MRAGVEEISGVFRDGGDVQFILPRFQRAYAWEDKDWQTLWNDAKKIMASNTTNLEHFLGAMVVVNIETGINEPRSYQLVDGQQRLLTISIFLCALRNLAKNEDFHREIRDYLVNKHREGLQHYKILPTVNNDDQRIWRSLLENDTPSENQGNSLINRSYRYFHKAIDSYAQENEINLAEMFRNFKKFLKVAVIYLDRDEQTHQIFESLNKTGKRLTQADLVRNYIAMRLNTKQQDEIWDNYWREIENLLKDSENVSSRGRRIGQLTGFFRHYLARQTYSLPNVDDVYEKFRDYMNERSRDDDDQFEVEMKTLHHYANHYKRLLDPETDGKIGKQIERLNKFEATASYPLLLYLYDRYHQHHISANSFQACLQHLENYLVRSFVGGTTNTQANRLYPAMVRQFANTKLTGDRFVTAFQIALVDRNYPSNERIRDVLKTENLYRGGKRAKLQFILKEISQRLAQERALDVRTELVGEPTIEHIMPQTLNPAWHRELGRDWERIYRELLNNIGNLTIVSHNFNITLSNKSFTRKRKELLRHGLDINHQYFENALQWNQEEIEKRRDWLVDHIIKLWPAFPKPYIEAEPIDKDEFNRKYPTRLTVLGTDLPVNRVWKNFAIQFTEYLIKSGFFEKISNQDLEFVRRNEPEDWPEQYRHLLSNGWWLYTGFWAYQAIQHCRQLAKFTGLSDKDWSFEL